MGIYTEDGTLFLLEYPYREPRESNPEDAGLINRLKQNRVNSHREDFADLGGLVDFLTTEYNAYHFSKMGLNSNIELIQRVLKTRQQLKQKDSIEPARS